MHSALRNVGAYEYERSVSEPSAAYFNLQRVAINHVQKFRWIPPTRITLPIHITYCLPYLYLYFTLQFYDTLPDTCF